MLPKDVGQTTVRESVQCKRALGRVHMGCSGESWGVKTAQLARCLAVLCQIPAMRPLRFSTSDSSTSSAFTAANPKGRSRTHVNHTQIYISETWVS